MPENDILEPPVTDKTFLKLIQAIQTVSIKSAVVDNTDTESSTKALSAGQGFKLQREVDADRGENSAYDPTATYEVGDFCINDNALYKCNTAISTPEAWDASHWDAVNLKGLDMSVTSLNTVEQLTPVVTMANIYSPDYTRLKKCGKLCSFSSDIQFRANGSGYIEAMTGLPKPLESLYFMAITDDGLSFSLAVIDDNGRLRIRNPLGGSDKKYFINVTYFTN